MMHGIANFKFKRMNLSIFFDVEKKRTRYTYVRDKGKQERYLRK